ncbi:MAG: acyl-CoA thioesterase [Ruminococcaceae bacterium]|nr:acyl-CoA thioesterase [Oscillospiraceae bacterium]
MKHEYIRRAYYHETDQMGIIHHSNYVKWMEEARISLLNACGLSYKKLEEEQIISPVLEIHTQYKNMVHFDEEVIITVRILEYDGIRLAFSYEMRKKEDGTICCLGESRHCFLNAQGRVISLKKAKPENDRRFREVLALPD